MKFIKKFPLVILLSVFLGFTFMVGCDNGTIESIVMDPPVWVENQTYELVLLHTNDHHGRILPVVGGTAPNETYTGGLAERATFVRSVRADNTNVLLVDAGDINTGTPLSNMFAAEPDIRAYNLMGYDAATFGNHEFDGTMVKLNKQIALANFPFVSSNIKTSNGRFLGGNQYLVKNYDGFRVGIIGITTLRTKTIASPDASLTFLSEISAAKAAVNQLQKYQKAGIIIALTHIGDVKETPTHVTSEELAAAVPGIDIIVDGHSHSTYATPKKVGNTWIVSANEWGKYVGNGKLTIKNGELADFDWQAINIYNEQNKPYAFEPAPDIKAMFVPYEAEVGPWLAEVVGEATDDFDWANIGGYGVTTRHTETAIGNMICDANVWYINNNTTDNIDFAFHNGGNIRANLLQGEITRNDVLTVLPFENILYIVSLKGSEIIQLFNFIGTIAQSNGGFPQFSSEVRYTRDITGNTVSDLTIGGEEVNPEKTYRFCTNEYLTGGGDGYTYLKDNAKDPFNTSLFLSEVVIEYIQDMGIITPELDGRLKVLNGKVIP